MPFSPEVEAAIKAANDAKAVEFEARRLLRHMLAKLGDALITNDPERFKGVEDGRSLDIDPTNFECDDPTNPVGVCIFGDRIDACFYCEDPMERK